MAVKTDERQADFGELPRDLRGGDATPPRMYAALTVTFLVLLLLGILVSRFWVLQALAPYDMRLPLISVVALHPTVPIGVGLLLMLTAAIGFLANNSRKVVAGTTIGLALGLLVLMIYVFGALFPFFVLVDSLS